MTSPIVITERQADYLDTERSTAQTVQEMCKHIRACLNDPLLHLIAAQCLDEAGIDSTAGAEAKAAAVWAWCKKNIRFVTDEQQLWHMFRKTGELELLISPSVMVRPELLESVRGHRRMEGDCDCFVMTVDTLCAILGVRPLIKTYKCDRQEPWRWAHVCGAALLENGDVIPIDASHGDYPGWEVPKQDVFASQLWDMNANKVGVQGMGSTRRSRGLSGYVSDRNWTGTPETTVRGPHAGAYPSLDFTRMYSGRRSGLGAIARRKFGMGAIVCDDSGINCYDDGTITSPADSTFPGMETLYNSPPQSNAPGANYIDTVTGQLINGVTGQVIANPTAAQLAAASSSSFNLSNFLSSLIAPATALTAKALQPGAQVLPNGSILLPNGQVVAGTPAVSSSNVLVIGGIVIAAVLLLSMGKK